LFEIVVEALRVVAAFSEGRGEGCVWRASKDLKFFSTQAESEREESHPHRSEESRSEESNPKSRIRRVIMSTSEASSCPHPKRHHVHIRRGMSTQSRIWRGISTEPSSPSEWVEKKF